MCCEPACLAKPVSAACAGQQAGANVRVARLCLHTCLMLTGSTLHQASEAEGICVPCMARACVANTSLPYPPMLCLAMPCHAVPCHAVQDGAAAAAEEFGVTNSLPDAAAAAAAAAAEAKRAAARQAAAAAAARPSSALWPVKCKVEAAGPNFRYVSVECFVVFQTLTLNLCTCMHILHAIFQAWHVVPSGRRYQSELGFGALRVCFWEVSG